MTYFLTTVILGFKPLNVFGPLLPQPSLFVIAGFIVVMNAVYLVVTNTKRKAYDKFVESGQNSSIVFLRTHNIIFVQPSKCVMGALYAAQAWVSPWDLPETPYPPKEIYKNPAKINYPWRKIFWAYFEGKINGGEGKRVDSWLLVTWLSRPITHKHGLVVSHIIISWSLSVHCVNHTSVVSYCEYLIF